jgi:hypothetical protein
MAVKDFGSFKPHEAHEARLRQEPETRVLLDLDWIVGVSTRQP